MGLTSDTINKIRNIEKEVLTLRAKYLKRGCEDIWISTPQADFISLDMIKIPDNRRNEGIGTDFMIELCELADKYSLTIGLYPTAEYGATLSRLINFYKRFGFIKNTYPNKDRNLKYSYPMLRIAKSEKFIKKEYSELVGKLLLEAFSYANVKSSNLKRIGYDPSESVLEIEFLSGGKYIYNDVPKNIFLSLKRAPSKGKYFWRKIRDVYEYERIL